MGARPGDESGAAAGGENPLNGRTLDVAAGCNKPAKRVVAKTVERLRKPEGGPKRRRCACAHVDATRDAAMRA